MMIGSMTKPRFLQHNIRYIIPALILIICLTLWLTATALAAPEPREPGRDAEAEAGGKALEKGPRGGDAQTLVAKPGRGNGGGPGRDVGAAPMTYISEFDSPAYPFTAISFQGLWGREVYEGAHGGQIWVCSSEGNAVEVTIDVPHNGGKLALYSARYWQCGYCSYELVNNGTGQVVKSGTVNLYYDNYDSHMPQYGFQVFKAAGLKKGAYTLRVENPGVPGTDQWPQELLEYFESQGMEPPPLPHMVNVDYLELRS